MQVYKLKSGIHQEKGLFVLLWGCGAGWLVL